jgi:3-oxoacyl-[acyl-carrier-protein] synthase-3
MAKIRAAITGIGAYLPDYVLNNEELSKLVDTSDEWIMKRIGIKERRIFKGEGKANSDMAVEAVKELFQKTGLKPHEVELIIYATLTPDMPLPSTATILADKLGIKNAMAFDISAACSGFIYALEIGAKFIESGEIKKLLIVASDKMSSITDYTDRKSCPLFGDAATAILLEPTTEELGVMDYIIQSDGIGRNYLYMKGGGSYHPASHETVDNKEHYVYQEGPTVFKYAVSKMADVSVDMMKRNNITAENLHWLVPHQANMRIIEATARRMGLEKDKVMINIEKYGNTTAATIPLCLWEWENKLQKGNNLILSAFGGGFTWGAIYLKWAYDPKK